MIQILVLLGMYFDAVVVFVTSQKLLFRLALAILCFRIIKLILLIDLFLFCRFKMDCDDPFVIKVDIKHQQMAPQIFDTNLNPWDVSSLYDFQYFCCPLCVFQGCVQDILPQIF